MIYNVNVSETLSKSIEIEASSPEEAITKVWDLYWDCEIILDASDYLDDSTIIEIDNCK